MPYQLITKLNQNMKIPNKILEVWKLGSQFGEIEKIHVHTGISRVTISKTLKTGTCSDDTFKKIANYFKDKKAKEQELIKENI